MKGVFDDKSERYYTYLGKVFSAINNIQTEYNWLITDCECHMFSEEVHNRIYQHKDYCWISGEELTDIIEDNDFQWVWAVLSGFKKDIPLEKVLKYELPFADGNPRFWKNPVSIQHPLADIEIVAFDSSFTLFISKDDSVAENFMRSFPRSRDLHEYNEEQCY